MNEQQKADLAKAQECVVLAANKWVMELHEFIIPASSEAERPALQQSMETLEDALAEIKAYELTAKTPRVIVDMSGGAIHSIETNGPMLVDLLDGDCDDANSTLPNGRPAWIRQHSITEHTASFDIDAQRIDGAVPIEEAEQ